MQELEQGRHELRLKLEGCQSQWESQVGELERDARELSAQVERLSQALSEAERDKSRAQLEHSEHTQRLREQLNTVSPNHGDVDNQNPKLQPCCFINVCNLKVQYVTIIYLVYSCSQQSGEHISRATTNCS